MRSQLLLGLLLTAATAFGQAGANDPTFDPGTGPNGSVVDLALQSDGKILIGGWFDAYNGVARNNIARLNSDGSLDPTFDPGTGADGGVQIIALQSDGKILIVGGFTHYNGVVRDQFARLNSDGSLDPSFDPGTGTDFLVYDIAIQPDGKILIGGWFDSYNGTARASLARLNSDGSLDPTFDPGTGPAGLVYTMALQPDGKILIGGLYNSYNGTYRKDIARLNSDGSLDPTFNPGTGPDYQVYAISVQPNGRILIGGSLNFTKAHQGTMSRA